MNENYLESMKRQFLFYKDLAEKAILQIPDEKLFLQFNDNSNSIAIIIKHLSGNMISRWTDFFTTDGEKEWRDRDSEFENNITSRLQLIEIWNKGWDCFLNTFDEIKKEDLEKIIYIRNQGHTVMEALNRQLAHYSYHIGQIVYFSKMMKENNWKSLSIPKNKSKDYNSEKFDQPKNKKHFTDEFINKNSDKS